MIKCIIFHSKINQIPLFSILLIIHLNLSITNCKPGLTDNACDTTSESNQNTIILKTLIGDNSPFCGVSLSNSSNQSTSTTPATTPTTTAPPVFYIYTNNIVVSGNLGNRATSSSSCQTMQTTSYSSLTCTNHMAVVSYSGDDLLNASANNAVPSSRPLLSATEMQVAPDWNTFVAGPLTISLNGAGVASSPPTPFYWTSTSSIPVQGSYDGSDNCTNNTDGTGGSNGAQGAITSIVAGHLNFANSQPCNGSSNSAYLMCVCWN